MDFLTLELLSNKNWVSLVFTVILTIRLPTWYLSFRNETAFHLICHSTWMRTTKQTNCFLYANMHIHRYISKKKYIYLLQNPQTSTIARAARWLWHPARKGNMDLRRTRCALPPLSWLRSTVQALVEGHILGDPEPGPKDRPKWIGEHRRTIRPT